MKKTLDEIEIDKNDIIEANKQAMVFFKLSLDLVSRDEDILKQFGSKSSLGDWYFDYIFNTDLGEYENFQEYIDEFSVWKK